MKKLVQTLLFVLTVACPLTAQSDLAPEQQKQFDERSLSVQLPAFSGLGVDPAHNWFGFQNHKVLSESSFYETAGFPELAKQATTQRHNGILLIILGVAGTIVGTAVLASSMQNSGPPYYEDKDIDSGVFSAGLVVAVASIVCYSIGFGKVQYKWSTVDQAKAGAEVFNFKLLQELKAGESGAEGVQ